MGSLEEKRSFWDGRLPDAPPHIPQVTLYMNQFKRFQKNYAELSDWAARVCGVPIETFCKADMDYFEAELRALRLVEKHCRENNHE